MYRFHPVGGPLVQFSNDFRTGTRIKSKTDVNKIEIICQFKKSYKMSLFNFSLMEDLCFLKKCRKQIQYFR